MLALIIWTGFAVSCAVLANHKGRTAIGWGVLGFAFGIIALIVLCFRPSLREDYGSTSESGGFSGSGYDNDRRYAA